MGISLSRIKNYKQRYEFLQQMLLEYCIRQLTRYENDVIQLSNNVAYRKADPLDHLEMIMAQTRLGTAEKIFSDMNIILEISRGG